MRARHARVLITGATGGIGEAMAAALVEAGAQVMLCARSQPRLERLAKRLGNRTLSVAAVDLCEADAAQRLADQAASHRINVVIHGAGIASFGALTETPASQLEAVTRTNLIAPMQLTQAMLPQLREQSRAQLIFIGSTLGRIGIPGFSGYCASKFGLYGFAEALRRELQSTSVLVQWLAPRATRTGFNDARTQAFNQQTGASSDSPQRVATAAVQLLESDRPQAHLGRFEALAVRLNALLGPRMDVSFIKHAQALKNMTVKPLNQETIV